MITILNKIDNINSKLQKKQIWQNTFKIIYINININ